jgi:hypothetical protein
MALTGLIHGHIEVLEVMSDLLLGVVLDRPEPGLFVGVADEFGGGARLPFRSQREKGYTYVCR